MKHRYTPNDIAIFFIVYDFTVSDERKVINDLWDEEENWSNRKYYDSKEHFIRAIYSEIWKYDGSYEQADEINMILQDMESSFYVNGEVDEAGVIESYFKIIKLRLTYLEGSEYCRIKLRTLIGKFGYKRRSKSLLDSIDKTIYSLKLKTYLRGKEPCNMADVKLDDVIIIRLS